MWGITTGPEGVASHSGRWPSNAFIVYVWVNMQDPVWVSEVLSGENGTKRQPRQGTK